MPEDRITLERRVDQLSAQVQTLAATVERLGARLESLTAAEAPGATESNALARGTFGVMPGDGTGGETTAAVGFSDDLLSWVGRASLLPRLSALSLLLVVALGLRTITDYGTIDKHLGSLIGMSYAAVLMLGGWMLYRRNIALAPVFAACGSLLMTVIVLETHARFGSLSTPAAYGLLTLTGVAMALLSRGYNRFLPVSLGILGMCLAGIAIDYPNPLFPALGVLLAVASLLGYSAARIRRCSWLRWSVLVISMGMMFLWAWKLRFGIQNSEPLHPGLEPRLLLPVVGLLGLLYPVLAFVGLARGAGDSRPSRFDLAAPALGAASAFMIVGLVAPLLHQERFLNWLGVGLALVLLAAAFGLAARRSAGTAAASAFALAAALLAALALPGASGSGLIALPLLSLAAFGLAVLARRWASVGMRVTSYLLQVYASVALCVLLRSDHRFGVSAASALAASAPALIGFLHYRWSRRDLSPRPEFGSLAARTGDPGAVFLLLASLLSAFFVLRVGIHQGLTLFPVDLKNSFRGAQSVLINLSAAGLMLVALARRNREVRNVAILVLLVGAFRVFVTDMLGTHGMPLVASLLSFGVAAALQSVALGRWARQSAREREARAG